LVINDKLKPICFVNFYRKVNVLYSLSAIF